MGKKKKFTQIWSNQTKIGERFGLSSIAVGKILSKYGLKDTITKLATKKALDDGYAKSTPLKDGTPYFMWNIQKIRFLLIEEKHAPLSKVDYWANKVGDAFKQADALLEKGEDKMANFLGDFAYEEVPKDILEQVKKKVEEK